ncbi:hypothetical protein P4597_10065 [Peribacillus simplex]|uniref:hypothetical protein n=1 Tax=Peribacillus simplex TaxID=1478 RepID=UPI002E1EE9EC|nr:hypothetical protein [Peribacillus simplex]
MRQRPKTVQRVEQSAPVFMVFYCNLHWIEEICDTPAELLASRDPTGAWPRRLGRQSAERERISEIN